MSYSYIGTFVDVKNKKRIVSADVSVLKNINERAYSCDLRDITPTGIAKDEDYPEITKDYIYEYVGYYKTEVADKTGIPLSPYRKKEWNKTLNAFYVTEEQLEANKEAIAPFELKPSFEELKSFDESRKDIIVLYVQHIRSCNGQWYRQEDFKKVEPAFKREYEDRKETLRGLKAFRNTKDWFELSEEGKESYFEELSSAEEMYDDAEISYNTLEYILNIFEFLKEDVGYPQVNEFKERSYLWEYEDKREIELYIEVD